jgi:antibiotic biosynthesis monooxygenase (ABM) superfamily enzyme
MVMTYTIEATGQEGWLAYRYQYKVGAHDYFGYAESESEALAIIRGEGDLVEDVAWSSSNPTGEIYEREGK